MEVAVVCLLLYSVINCLDSGRAGVSLTVDPQRSQFFKYERFSVSCEEEEEEEEEEWAGWRVMKRTEDGEVHACPSSCSISTGFPATDSGAYWCETGLGKTSSTINITVTAGSVILESPARPATEGDNVTLRCRTRVPGSGPSAQFFRDGLLIASSSSGQTVLHGVSRADEGLYRCHARGDGDSPASWLRVRAAPPAGQEVPAPPGPALLLRHLAVGTPYLVSTVLLGLVCRDRRRELRAQNARSDDVIMHLYA